VEIHWHHVDEIPHDQRASIEERLRVLGAEHDDLIDVRISGQDSGHHRQGGKQISIACLARGKEIVAVRDELTHALALDAALDAFVRELRKHRQRRRQRPRIADSGLAAPLLGVVDRVIREADYGFVLTDSGERVYFHRLTVHGGLDFAKLREGERVALQVESGSQGPQAKSVLPAPTPLR
jgi:cold shock CspA family protein/ribosome-associated translation inhibitor RaiA